jgi:hypothetical protein
MNQKIRKRIKDIAIEQGIKHTTEDINGFTLDSYSGKVTVEFCGSEYIVVGHKARKHAVSFTNGYCSVSQVAIGRGLR